MPSPRTLPMVIGPTENALRALLTTTLAATPIRTYPAWAVVNAAPTPDRPDDRWRARVADALKVGPDVVGQVLAELEQDGLVDSQGSLTPHGEEARASARAAVGATTGRLLDGVDAGDEATARRVLEQMRVRAEALLAQ